jgi:hypothetical protein
MNIVDEWYWRFQQNELKKILFRITVGLCDQSDLCIAYGILNSFLNSSEEALQDEANEYLNNIAEFKNFKFNSDKNNSNSESKSIEKKDYALFP